MIRARVFISGKVQGVFFRAHTKARAERLGLTGWVRNLPDGRVEVVFEGSKEYVEEMVEWCWQGSPGAKVESVNVRRDKASGEFGGFKIKR
jgi:acylphosphatase